MVTAAAMATENMQNMLNTSMHMVDLDVSFMLSMVLEED